MRGEWFWGAACAALAAGSLHAAELPHNYGPRDLTGMWVLDKPQAAVLDPATVPLTQEAVDKAKAIARRQAEGHLLSEGHIRCLPDGMPHMMAAPFGVEFLQTKNRVTVLAEISELPRTIFLDRKAHTPDLDPSWNGESIAHWQGDVLMVDTIGFNDRYANLFNFGIGALRTPALHIVENIRLLDHGRFMEDAMTLEDPAVFTHPYTITYHYKRLPEADAPMEYVCEVERAQLDALEAQQSQSETAEAK